MRLRLIWPKQKKLAPIPYTFYLVMNPYWSWSFKISCVPWWWLMVTRSGKSWCMKKVLIGQHSWTPVKPCLYLVISAMWSYAYRQVSLGEMDRMPSNNFVPKYKIKSKTKILWIQWPVSFYPEWIFRHKNQPGLLLWMKSVQQSELTQLTAPICPAGLQPD